MKAYRSQSQVFGQGNCSLNTLLTTCLPSSWYWVCQRYDCESIRETGPRADCRGRPATFCLQKKPNNVITKRGVPMPDRDVTTIGDLIYYQYAKIIAKSAFGVPDGSRGQGVREAELQGIGRWARIVGGSGRGTLKVHFEPTSPSWFSCTVPPGISLPQPRSLQTAGHRSMGSSCESRWKKMIGKPYSGKLNVRFDEGELETAIRSGPSRCVHQKDPMRLQPGASSLL